MRVEDAQGAPPPFRSGLARRQRVRPSCPRRWRSCGKRLRRACLSQRLPCHGCRPKPASMRPGPANRRLHGADDGGAGRRPKPARGRRRALFDEAGGMQVVLHAPFGGRINRAWGWPCANALLTFDFEIQAAATDDGIVLSLGAQHSFPLENVFAMVRDSSGARSHPGGIGGPDVRKSLAWNSTRALAILRHQGEEGARCHQRMRRKTCSPPSSQRNWPARDNHTGPSIPDHPLVNETIANCLRGHGHRRTAGAVDRSSTGGFAPGDRYPLPSPMTHEILNAVLCLPR